MFLGKRKSLPKTKIWDVSSAVGSYAYTLKHTVVTKRTSIVVSGSTSAYRYVADQPQLKAQMKQMHMNGWEEKYDKSKWWEMQAANCFDCCFVFAVITPRYES